MVEIKLVCVGGQREKWMKGYSDDLEKSINRLAGVSLKVVEVREESLADNMSGALHAIVKKAEGDRIMGEIGGRDFVIALAIEGKKMTDMETRSLMDKAMERGKSSFVFVIGGSIGIDEAVMKRADFLMSFSDMTFPHQRARVIALKSMEEVFRCSR
jgi:23S rRNA (pseudouridine1915-N3)-methyltransferase